MRFLALPKKVSSVCLAVAFTAIVAGDLRALPWPQQTATPAPASPQQTKSPTAAAESGKFILHKFEQPIGEETYQIISDGNSLTAKIDFKFTDRGSTVPMTATFKAASDL